MQTRKRGEHICREGGASGALAGHGGVELERPETLPCSLWRVPPRYYNFNCPRDRQYVIDTLFTGLQRLEYRGYDSSGVCIDGDVFLHSPPPSAIPKHCNGDNGRPVSPMKFMGRDGAMQKVEPTMPLVLKSVGKISDLVKSAQEELKQNSVRAKGMIRQSRERERPRGREREQRAQEDDEKSAALVLCPYLDSL